MFKVLKVVLILLVAIPLICIGLLALYLNFYTADLPDVRQLGVYDGSTPRELNRLPWGESAKLVVISPNQMGYLRPAVLSAEGELDSIGVYSRTYRRLTEDVVHSHGGNYSLQLARTVLLGHYRLSHRAIAEMRYAHQVERRFTPEQILFITMNTADFGSGNYGVEAASQYYFGRSAAQLSLGEAAMLAGMIRSPSRLSPFSHPDQARERRNEVLDGMLREGRITAEECKEAKSPPMLGIDP